jgi:ferredoxin
MHRQRSINVPRLEVVGYGVFDVPEGTRLVRAIESNGVDILHRCGGFARCTTCRVEFVAGEPATMTEAEYDRLVQRELLGQIRLSCQIRCDHDMTVKPVNTLAASGLPDPGPTPAETITPEPVWRARPY